MNNFYFRGPLPLGSPLYKGRTADLEKLIRWCEGEPRHYGIVFGARQSGKSSLLLRLEERLTNSRVVCRTDFEYLSNAAPARIFSALAQGFSCALEGSNRELEIRDALQLGDYLCGLLEAHPSTRIVLLVEELGALPKPSRLVLANALRAIFNDRVRPTRRALNRLMVIVAGNTELYDLTYTEVSPFANICESHYLNDLSQSEAEELICDGLAEYGLQEFELQAAGRQIYDVAHGFPYLTHRLGHVLAEALDGGVAINSEIIRLGMNDMIMGDDSLIRHLERSLIEKNLFSAAQMLLKESPRFDRHDEQMALLELAGFIRPENGRWVVRNQLFAHAVEHWLKDFNIPEFEPLRTSLVRILNRGDSPVGAGFLVDGNRILTCGHVITDALGVNQSSVMKLHIPIDFPLLLPGEKFFAHTVKIQEYKPGDAKDIAILEMDNDLPSGAKPLRFSGMQSQWNQTFRVMGFPQGRKEGVWATGELRGKIADGRIQLEDTKNTGYPIAPGFSGSPVWNETSKSIVGMVVATDTDKNIKAAFIIPAHMLLDFLNN